MEQSFLSRFTYVTYIRSDLERLWAALTTPELTQTYWFQIHFETSWKAGSAFRLIYPDGRVADTGEILEIEPPHRLVLKWRNEFVPEMTEEGYSRCEIEITALGEVARVSVEHTIERAPSKFIEGVSRGWPAVLSGLKSLLETGEALQLPAL